MSIVFNTLSWDCNDANNSLDLIHTDWFRSVFCHTEHQRLPTSVHVSFFCKWNIYLDYLLLFPTFLCVMMMLKHSCKTCKPDVLKRNSQVPPGFRRKPFFWCDLKQNKKRFHFLLSAVAVHCWRAMSAYTWSDVDRILLTLCSSMLSCRCLEPIHSYF